MGRIITRLPTAAADDALERAMLEVDAAIALVVTGIAVTITLCCFEGAETAAFAGAAWAQAAGVAFRLGREPAAPVRLVIGPRLRPVAALFLREMES
jgi:hypothetical protein